MKIKVKIKTLILLTFLLILTFIWVIPTTIHGIANLLQDNGSDKATFFYEKYASYPTTPKIEGNFLYAKSLVKGFSKYAIFYNGWGGGENTSPEDMEKSKNILQDIMKETPYMNSEKQYYIDSYKMLLEMAIATGDTEMLHNWISFGQKADDERLVYISDIYNGFLLHVNGDRDEAKDIVAKYELTALADVKLDILKAEITLFDGNYEEAKKMYENISRNNWRELQDSNFGSTAYYDRDFWVDRVMKVFSSDNTIKGTVTYEGKPMPFVEIYVQAADGGFRTVGESYVGITDENGKFETLGLKYGVYNVGIGVEGSLLTNKVLQQKDKPYFEFDGNNGEINFEFRNILNIKEPSLNDKITGEEFTIVWEEVKGAVYYKVDIVTYSNPSEGVGAIFYTPAFDEYMQSKFTETQATFNTSLIKDEIGGMSIGEDGLIGANAVLGAFVPGLEYPIVVKAYDENMNLITSSLPLRAYYDQIPSITVEGSHSDGEKMILNQDYPEAIEYYENILNETPDDIEALRYLIKIYGIGWKNGEKNIERAIELGQRYTYISGSNRLLINIISQMEIDEIKKYSDLFYSAVTEESEDQNDSYYYYLSKYFIATENWKSARNALQNTEGYLPVNLFYLNMYLENYTMAAENTKYLYNSPLKSIEVKEALRNLEDIPPHHNDKQIFNNFLLKLVTGVQREEGKGFFDEIIKQISNSNLKTILNAIYLERGWDISSNMDY